MEEAVASGPFFSDVKIECTVSWSEIMPRWVCFVMSRYVQIEIFSLIVTHGVHGAGDDLVQEENDGSFDR